VFRPCPRSNKSNLYLHIKTNFLLQSLLTADRSLLLNRIQYFIVVLGDMFTADTRNGLANKTRRNSCSAQFSAPRNNVGCQYYVTVQSWTGWNRTRKCVVSTLHLTGHIQTSLNTTDVRRACNTRGKTWYAETIHTFGLKPKWYDTTRET
jgi:hypothetical protein